MGLHDSFLPSFCIFPEKTQTYTKKRTDGFSTSHLQSTFPRLYVWNTRLQKLTAANLCLATVASLLFVPFFFQMSAAHIWTRPGQRATSPLAHSVTPKSNKQDVPWQQRPAAGAAAQAGLPLWSRTPAAACLGSFRSHLPFERRPMVVVSCLICLSSQMKPIHHRCCRGVTKGQLDNQRSGQVCTASQLKKPVVRNQKKQTRKH